MRRVVRFLQRLDDLAERVLMRKIWIAVAAGALLWSCFHRTAAPVPVPVPRPPPPPIAAVRFDVHTTEIGAREATATITVFGYPTIVHPGTILPAPGFGPARLIITRIEEHSVSAYDVAKGYVTRVESEELIARVDGNSAIHSFKVNAIAGDAPNFVAVLEYKGQTYIVQKGTNVPDDKAPELRVKSVTNHSVIAEARGGNIVQELDLEGI